MMGTSRYLATKWLDMLRGVPFTAPSTVYVALYTTLPDKNNTGGVEVGSGIGYSRLAVTFPAVFADGSDNDVIENLAELLWPMATAPWGTIAGAGLLDDDTAGNLLYYGPLETPRIINENDRFRFAEGDVRAGIGTCP